MSTIVLDANKVNSYALPSLNKSENLIQTAYTTSVSLRNNLPSSFNQRSAVNEIVNQIYTIKKEINDIEGIIESKLQSAKRIESKNESRVSSIAASASKLGSVVGAVAGAALGARTGGVVGTVAGAAVGAKIGSKAASTIANTGAKVANKFVSKVKSLGKAASDYVKTGVKKVANKAKSAWEKFSGSVKKVASKVSDATKKVGKALYNTGAKIKNGFTSACKSIGNGIKNLWNAGVKVVKKAASFISSAIKGLGNVVSKIIKAVSKVPQFIMNTKAKIFKGTVSVIESIFGVDLSKLKLGADKVSNFYNSIIDKAGSLVGGLVNGIANYWGDFVTNPKLTIKRTGATIANVCVSLLEGVVSFVEAIGDVVLLVAGGVCSIGSFFADLYNGLFLGDWDWSNTSAIWKKWIVPWVGYNWTSDWMFKKYSGSKLDSLAYDWAKRDDGIGYSIGKGVGYYAGMIAVSLLTCGAAAGAVGATSASAAASTPIMGSITLKTVATAGSVAVGTMGKETQTNYSEILETAKKENRELTSKEILAATGKAAGKAAIEGGVFFAAGAAGDVIKGYSTAVSSGKDLLNLSEKTVKFWEFASKNQNNIQTGIKATKAYISEGYSCKLSGEEYNWKEAHINAASIVIAEKAANLFNTNTTLKQGMYQVPKDSTSQVNLEALKSSAAIDEMSAELNGTFIDKYEVYNSIKVGFGENIKYAAQNGLNKGEEKLIKSVATEISNEILE